MSHDILSKFWKVLRMPCAKASELPRKSNEVIETLPRYITHAFYSRVQLMMHHDAQWISYRTAKCTQWNYFTTWEGDTMAKAAAEASMRCWARGGLKRFLVPAPPPLQMQPVKISEGTNEAANNLTLLTKRHRASWAPADARLMRIHTSCKQSQCCL